MHCLGILGIFDKANGRQASKGDPGKHKEMKKLCDCGSTNNNGLQTYLVAFTILYLLI